MGQKRRKKQLFVYPDRFMITLIKSALHKTGGLEKYTWALARDFCALKAPVTLLTTGLITPPFTDPLLQIISFPIHSPLSVLQLLKFDKACSSYLCSHPCPIIFSLDRTRFQTHIRAGNGVHAEYLRMRQKQEGPLKALSLKCNPLHRTICALEKEAFEDPALNTLFTNSHLVKKEILKHFATPREKIEIIHNGVEWQAMQADFNLWEEKKSVHMQRLKLDPSLHQLLFIGHNYQRKGLEPLLLALSHLKAAPFQLSVLGKDKQIPYYQNYAKRLGLSHKVFFFGPQDTMPFYQLADTLVIPSLYDPFANVTVEALAMGLFVLSSTTNGGHEVLTPETGKIIEDLYNPHQFAALLQATLERPKTAIQALAIRSSIGHLDFSKQLRLMTEKTLNLDE